MLSKQFPELYKLSSIEAVAKWLMENQEAIDSKANSIYKKNDVYKEKRKYDRRIFRFKSIEFTDVYYSSRLSNTHACPKGRVTNWSGVLQYPIGYPGWHSRIKIVMNDRNDLLDYDLLKKLYIHTGTGGGGSVYEFDCRMFAEDWPRIFMTQRIAGDIPSTDSLEGTYRDVKAYFKEMHNG